MLIVGLGNTGLKYKNTYHNCGFAVVDKLADMLNVKFSKTECRAKTATAQKNGERIVIAKPQTYMNLSGEAVRELMGKYRETADSLLVIYDDADIPAGHIRLRKEGSGGTHNGMRNIIELIGTSDFKRVRIGIGNDRGLPLIDFVLQKVGSEDKPLLNDAVSRAADAIFAFITGADFERVMQQYNK